LRGRNGPSELVRACRSGACPAAVLSALHSSWVGARQTPAQGSDHFHHFWRGRRSRKATSEQRVPHTSRSLRCVGPGQHRNQILRFR